MKLGKRAAKYNPKSLYLSTYLGASVPPPPPEKTFWEYKVPPDTIGMYGNDEIGDCTCAAVAHMVILATAHTGKVVFPDPEDVLTMYSAVSGYVPGDDSTDNGAAITDVLEYWQTNGLSGHKITAWAALDYKNVTALHQGIHIFGANDVGVQLPTSAQTQFAAGKNWEVVKHSAIEGGHCIIETGYGSDGSNYQTWGKGDQKASNAWSQAYRDEAYVVITPDWIKNADGLTPSGFHLDALMADIKVLSA